MDESKKDKYRVIDEFWRPIEELPEDTKDKLRELLAAGRFTNLVVPTTHV